MPTRREDRERRRAERQAAERAQASAERRRLIIGYIVAGVLGAAVLGGIVIAVAGSGGSGGNGETEGLPEEAHVNQLIGVFPDGAEADGRAGTPPPEIAQGDLETAAEAAGCELRLGLPNEGSTHFTDEDKDQKYDTNPPTSGDHYGVPTEAGSGALADGAYLNTPPITRAVHALEHGRIEIQYSLNLPDEDQLALKGVFDENPGGVILFPNPDMPYEVAVTAWTNLMGCESYEGAATLDAIRDFRDIYRGQGPENVPVEVSG